jgi:hypothetical protein
MHHLPHFHPHYLQYHSFVQMGHRCPRPQVCLCQFSSQCIWGLKEQTLSFLIYFFQHLRNVLGPLLYLLRSQNPSFQSRWTRVQDREAIRGQSLQIKFSCGTCEFCIKFIVPLSFDFFILVAIWEGIEV